METKNKLKSLTIQGAAFVLFLESLPRIISEINNAIPSVDLMANPLIVELLKYAGIAVIVYGRLRAKTKLT